jgi:outer membrane receptor for ferrienterochelin and colicins
LKNHNHHISINQYFLCSASNLKGNVSADGMLLVQANVLLKKANKSIVTDTDGNYIIKDLAAGDYEIAVSYNRFRTEKRSITVIEAAKCRHPTTFCHGEV